MNAIFSITVQDLKHPNLPRQQKISQSSRPVLLILLKTIKKGVFLPTSAILYQFGEAVLFGRLTQVARYKQEVFAWR